MTYPDPAYGGSGTSPIDSITVEEFAHLLYWERWVDKETSEKIAKAANLAEALAAARREGVVLEEVPYYAEINNKAQEEYRADSGRSPGGRGELTANQGPSPVTVGQAVLDAVDEGSSVIDALRATGLQPPDEDEIGYSALLFPGGISGINEVRHLQMVTGDDYSPFFGKSREQAYNEAPLTKWLNLEPYAPEAVEARNYWRNQYLQPGGYVSGQELITWAGLSTQARSRIENEMVTAGLLDPDGGYVPGSMGMPQLEAMRAAMSVGTYQGVGYEIALQRMGADYQAFLRAEAKRKARQGGGGTRPKFSIPASLRQIPDYESLAQESTNMFRQSLGRDIEDYEVEILADTLKSRYRERNAEMIKAAKAAFYDSVGGATGVREVEVPDPQLRLQRFIEDRYESELERQGRVEDQAVNNRLMIDAITRGTQMVSS